MSALGLRRIVALAATGLGLHLAMPAVGQVYSDGFKFLQAVKKKNGDEATVLLNTPGNTVINARDLTSGETGLHYTIQRRDVVWTRWLLQENANPNIADRHGVTPLILAVRINFLDGVEALIKGGAQVDAGNATGETPLITAVHARNYELIEILLRAGANPDRTDNSGRSARQYASERGAGTRTLAVIEEFEKPASQGAEARNVGPGL